ncbi:MAG: sigma-54-dependent Fis family transcriptional regulator [Acidobacteria bacterium]|nr:sigma-54-dependent Fis family transcriptional regulator [Acidobacteriota bacterium]
MRSGRFELADGGTLFLDEIGEMAPALQLKLLRALQERAFERVGGAATVSVDVRVVAATHRDLETAMGEGRFREDLYYRLNVVRIDVPPLRARPEDVPALVEHFLARYGCRDGGRVVSITPEARAALQAHPWPGNVRQLENVIHRATILCESDTIGVEDVALELSSPVPETGGSLDLRAALDRVERDLVARALREHHGNLTAAGRALGIDRNLLRSKLRKHGLRP